MKRRGFLAGIGQLSFAAGISTLLPISVNAQSMHLEITRLLATIQIDLLMKNYASARQRALQLVPISQQDPNWFNYPESFQIASILYQLTPPTDRDAWIFAARGVLECFPGITEGNSIENYRIVGSAAYGLLQADAVRSVGLPQIQLDTIASLLLFVSGASPGSDRVIWAQAARRGIQRYGGTALASWANDKITPRFVTAGIAVSGDWKTAAADYERMLAQSVGNIDNLLKRRASTVGGLAGLIAGATTMESEAATAIAMGGHIDRAMELLEKARRNTISLRRGASATGESADGSAAQLEARLAATGTVIVQPVASILGAFALVSVRRGKAIQHFTAFSPDHGGVELIGRLLNSGSLHFSKDGLIPSYQRISKDRGKDQHRKLLAYCDRATEDAELLIGATIRSALHQAKVSSTADVLVILPANLAVLPVGLATPGVHGQALCREFQLRYADSLVAAVHATERAKKYATLPATVEFMGTDEGTSGLPIVGFERDCVTTSFKAAPAVDATPLTGKKSGFSWPERGGYWHVASHASWNFGDPGKSGIITGRKQVATVDDVLKLDLKEPPRLIFLSACETALINVKQDLDRFVGLPTAFLAAGAGGVIGSQWPVSDTASALLAAYFYDQHLESHYPPALALAKAQRWIASSTAAQFSAYVVGKVTSGKVSREDSGSISTLLAGFDSASTPFENPYFWGGYQLYGT